MTENAMMLAGVFGPWIALIGLWALVYSDNMKKVLSSMNSTPAAFYLRGVVNLLLGIFIVNQYNVWMWNVALLVTLLGWVMLVRGLIVLFIPQLMMKGPLSHAKVVKVIGIIPLVWGVVLTWFACAG